jgi:hypothetical protein
MPNVSFVFSFDFDLVDLIDVSEELVPSFFTAKLRLRNCQMSDVSEVLVSSSFMFESRSFDFDLEELTDVSEKPVASFFMVDLRT